MALMKVIHVGGRLLRRAILCVMGLTAVASLGPIAAVSLSMAVSLAVYAAAFGIQFAIGFVLLLFFHELGHMVAARAVGVSSSGPLFVPFIGAVVNLGRAPVNAKMEANIAIGGPAMGTLTALGCLASYFWTDNILLLVLAYTACLLNLFNLIPCNPLDGGRIAGAISPHLWWIGSLSLGILFFATRNLLILIIFLFSIYRLWRGERTEFGEQYFQLTLRQRLQVAWWYFGLLVVLSLLALYLSELLR